MTKISELTDLLTRIDEQSDEVKKIIYSTLQEEMNESAIKYLKTSINKVKKKYRYKKINGIREPSKRTINVMAEENKVIDYLKNSGGATIDDVSKELGVDYSTAHSRLTRLYRKNPHIKLNDKQRPFIFYYDKPVIFENKPQ